MRQGVTHSLTYQFSIRFDNITTRQNRGNIQKTFLPLALLHCTHTRFYKAVHYRKNNIFTKENLQNISFRNLCGVADWLIINGLNAILQCASSYDSYLNSAVAEQSTTIQDKGT